MLHRSPARPLLLSKLNERELLRTLLAFGPMSRADLARSTGMTPPTVSKAADSLLTSGHLEENEPAEAFGRPAKRLGLATRSVQVLGLVIDADLCRVVAAGLDGQIQADHTREFSTPDTYETLISEATLHARELMSRAEVKTVGMGVSIPGLVDYRQKRSLLSPNVPITNGRRPGEDLGDRLGVQCVLVQEEHALCLAERNFGNAKGLNDFAILDVSTGVGLGVMSGGRLLEGRSGLAGEIGHITVDVHGRQCGCGNAGCLETVACDSALAWTVSQRLDRKITIEEILIRSRTGPFLLPEEVRTITDYLAVALSAVINLFNPSSLFVHGRVFELNATLFSDVVRRSEQRALAPSFADCQIVQARGSKRLGAVAAIIEHLFERIVPKFESEAVRSVGASKMEGARSVGARGNSK
jgi:predicted NBD/HSP70 family sugar kinase